VKGESIVWDQCWLQRPEGEESSNRDHCYLTRLQRDDVLFTTRSLKNGYTCFNHLRSGQFNILQLLKGDFTVSGSQVIYSVFSYL